MLFFLFLLQQPIATRSHCCVRPIIHINVWNPFLLYIYDHFVSEARFQFAYCAIKIWSNYIFFLVQCAVRCFVRTTGVTCASDTRVFGPTTYQKPNKNCDCDGMFGSHHTTMCFVVYEPRNLRFKWMFLNVDADIYHRANNRKVSARGCFLALGGFLN